jgi:cellobiose transport system substrate-binding protein
VAAGALVLTACGGSGDEAAEDGTITLSISTFNEFGYDELIEEYMADHPGVVVEQTKASTGDELREKIITGLAAGSGLTDVVAVDVSWLPELMEYSDRFVDLSSEDVEGRWPEWKTAGATTADGELIGYGTDIGPEVIAYRADLFAAAGLPTDRAAVAELLGGDDATWETYLQVGQQFTDATGTAWFDSADAIYEGMINQLDNPYESDDDELIALDNPEVREYYDTVTDAAANGLSAGLSQWSTDWQAAFQGDEFATMLAPSWMLNTIAGNSAGSDAVWDIADVFPGGGGNWGGSYLAVPTQSKHPEEARELAAWLTAPEQQVRAFEVSGNFPSATDALTDPTVTALVNEDFNNAPTGEIYANAASGIESVAHKGPKFFALTDAMRDAIDRVDVAKTDDAESSWKKFVSEVESLG